MCAWAVSVPDINAEEKRLKSAGIEITPSSSGRQRPDGVSLRWSSASVGPAPQGSFFPFLIQDLTLRALRVYPQGKAFGARHGRNSARRGRGTRSGCCNREMARRLWVAGTANSERRSVKGTACVLSRNAGCAGGRSHGDAKTGTVRRGSVRDRTSRQAVAHCREAWPVELVRSLDWMVRSGDTKRSANRRYG